MYTCIFISSEKAKHKALVQEKLIRPSTRARRGSYSWWVLVDTLLSVMGDGLDGMGEMKLGKYGARSTRPEGGNRAGFRFRFPPFF